MENKMKRLPIMKNLIFILSICGLFMIFFAKISLAEPYMKFIQPEEGQIFKPGDEVPIVFEASNLSNGILITSRISADRIETLPYTFNLKIPDEEIGILEIKAFAPLIATQEVLTDDVTINIQPNAPLESIQAGRPVYRTTKTGVDKKFRKVSINEDSDWKQMTVEGVYEDGVTRNIRYATTGTTYSSHDENIVTVGENGKVYVQGVGEALITVTNSGISTDVPVIVKKKWESRVKEKIPPVTVMNFVPPANPADWHNQDISVTLTATDNEGGSGVKEIYYLASGAINEGRTVVGDTATVTIVDEGTTALTYYATDNAGNAEAEQTAEFNLDKTPPTVVMPNLESSYIYNSNLTLSYSSSDDLSGLDNVTATFNGVSIVNGETVTLSDPGANEFKVVATDLAGNATIQASNFDVQYSFSGFLPPVEADGSGVYKLGRTLPVKFQLQDAQQAYIPTATARITLQQFSEETPVGEPIEVESTSGADTGNLFRYDADDDQYIFNLNTKSLSPGAWQIQVHITDDGSLHTGMIQLK